MPRRIEKDGPPRVASETSARSVSGGTPSDSGSSERTTPEPGEAGAKTSVATFPLAAAIARACANSASKIVAADRVANARSLELKPHAIPAIIMTIAVTSKTSISVVPRCAFMQRWVPGAKS